MIRMIQSSSAGHAKAYFNDALSKSDYYTQDQELAGILLGRLGERLGLGRDVTKELFYALCENINPKTGASLTPQTREQRRVGYDINFHSPKSLSILHGLSKDGHIAATFQDSVRTVMRAIEADCQTRVRKGGAFHNRPTDELVWAEFMHNTARPVDGFAPDPHLHIHAFVFNMTWDKEENRIKAGDFAEIKKSMPYYEALFHKTLSDNLIKQGYQIRKTARSFEIEGVPQKVIDLFSKRTNEIGQFAKIKGIHDPKKLSELGAITRSKKQKGISMTELKGLWHKQILDSGEPAHDETIRYSKKEKLKIVSDRDCIDYASKHSFERASVMPERRLLESALRHGIGEGQVSSQDIFSAFEKDKSFIRVKDRGVWKLTTKAVLQEEREMVELAKEGINQIKPLNNKPPQMDLNGQQANAVEYILTTSNRISIVMGAAGTGKTRLLQTAERLINDAGKRVIVVAPTAEASKGVLVSDGFKDATTVAKLLSDRDMQNTLKDQVLWVDESGMLGTKDMLALLKLSKEKNAQLILGGDTRQHASVVRGDALRILNTVAGVRAAEVSKIYRQKTFHYKNAVEDLSKGKVATAFSTLENMGAIQEVDPLKPNEDLVKDYVAFIKKGKSALVISPTHKQGDDVTDAIRTKMKKEGLLGKKELTITRLVNLNLTEAQKTDARNFTKGQIVQFNQNLKKIKRGSRWMVMKTENNEVVVSNEKGEERILPKSNPISYDVLEMSAINVARGDKIKISRNGFDNRNTRLNNGQTLEVLAVNKKGQIKLQNKQSKKIYEIDKEFGHLSHAHCITSYAAQGKTVDHVLICQPAATFPATDARQFYVSVSRGKESARIYTDDRSSLLDYASQMGDRQSALELVNKNNFHTEQVIQQKQKEYGKGKNLEYIENKKSLHKEITIEYEP